MFSSFDEGNYSLLVIYEKLPSRTWASFSYTSVKCPGIQYWKVSNETLDDVIYIIYIVVKYINGGVGCFFHNFFSATADVFLPLYVETAATDIHV